MKNEAITIYLLLVNIVLLVCKPLSLNPGNNWTYLSEYPDNPEEYVPRLITKMVTGRDTIINDNKYSIIEVKSVPLQGYSGNTYDYLNYWRVTDQRFYSYVTQFYNIEFEDSAWCQTDSIYGGVSIRGVTNDSIVIFNQEFIAQHYYKEWDYDGDWGFGGSYFIKYIGIVKTYSYGCYSSYNRTILQAAYIDGQVFGDPSLVSIKENNSVIKNTTTLQNYPNPFNPSTNISYSLPDEYYGLVKLNVYNVKGELVANLVDKYQKTGKYTISFNGNNLPNGIYFYKLQTEHFTTSKKMILTK